MTAVAAKRPRRGASNRTGILLTFLGSMNLAITLLVAVGIASVIGSVLQQDQSWAAYLVKFGPFWFEVFRVLGLYDVYSAPWFIAMLAFLMISTAVCVYRHAPAMWKEVTRFRERQADASLRAHRNHHQAVLPVSVDQARTLARQTLRGHGYRMREQLFADGRYMLGAMRGGANRLGYLLTHIAVVVICVGGLIDANPWLLWLEWTNQLRIETRNDLPLSELHPDSLLPPGTTAFRGNISIPEGGAARAVYLDRGEGYVAQELPFTIEVEAFRSHYWHNGQPRAYESDLVIHDPERAEPLRTTIAVNEPFQYRGHTIYQASYSDGGTAMQLMLWPIGSRIGEPVMATTAVHADLPLNVGGRQYLFEMVDFEKHNMRPDESEDPHGSQDVGPSFTYRIRQATGEAREFHNFMRPMPVDGRWYYLTGMRASEAEDYRYLYVPADPNGELHRFTRLVGILQNAEQRAAAAERAVERLFAASDDAMGASLAPYLVQSADGLVTRFLDGGPPAVEAAIRHLVAQSGIGRDAAILVAELLQEAMHATLAESYRQTLIAEGYPPEQVRSGAMSDWDNRFYLDAMEALMVLPAYGAPVYPQLMDFEHRQATGLQITRTPGQATVYVGCLMLVVGVFLLFYVHQRRVWVRLVSAGDEQTSLLMAGVDQRRSTQFDDEFGTLVTAFTQAASRQPSTAVSG